MRVMVLIKANQDSEAGKLPSERMLGEMMQFNEELAKSGILLAGDGLQASSKGKRVRFSGAKRTVIDGPFTETKELVAGFWIWKVASMDEAIAWVKRVPNCDGELNETSETTEIEIRPLFESEDFGSEFTPELREKEARIRAQAERGS